MQGMLGEPGLVSRADGVFCDCKSGFYFEAKTPLTCSACDDTCKTCIGQGPQQCDTSLSGQKCKCEDRTFLATTQPFTCQDCHKTCTGCTGPEITQCTACQPGRCFKCHGTSATCNGEGETNCLTCTPNADLVPAEGGKTCNCTTGFYSEGNTPLVCERYTCDLTCKTCKGPKKDQCLDCNEGYDFKDGTSRKRNCHGNCLECLDSE